MNDDDASIRQAKDACARQLRELQHSYMGKDVKARFRAEQLRFDNLLRSLEGAQRERRRMQGRIRLMEVVLACIEKDATAPPERPLELWGASCEGISSGLCVDAIPHPSQWDDVWVARIRALTAKELIVLHKQHLRRVSALLELGSEQSVSEVTELFHQYSRFGRRLQEINPVNRLERQAYNIDTLAPVDKEAMKERWASTYAGIREDWSFEEQRLVLDVYQEYRKRCQVLEQEQEVLRAAYAAANQRHQAAIERLAALPLPRPPRPVPSPSAAPPLLPVLVATPPLPPHGADAVGDYGLCDPAEEAEWVSLLSSLLPEDDGGGSADTAPPPSPGGNKAPVALSDGGSATASLTDATSTAGPQLQQRSKVLPQPDSLVSSVWGGGWGEADAAGAAGSFPLVGAVPPVHHKAPAAADCLGGRLEPRQRQQQGSGGCIIEEEPQLGPQPQLLSQCGDGSTAGACNLEALLHEMEFLARALQANIAAQASQTRRFMVIASNIFPVVRMFMWSFKVYPLCINTFEALLMWCPILEVELEGVKASGSGRWS